MQGVFLSKNFERAAKCFSEAGHLTTVLKTDFSSFQRQAPKRFPTFFLAIPEYKSNPLKNFLHLKICLENWQSFGLYTMVISALKLIDSSKVLNLYHLHLNLHQKSETISDW
jgi:hypothetical protein